MYGAIASSAASLAGAYLTYLGQQQANKRNLDYQDKANLMTTELANTAHRREVEDLRAAGLNPILSAGGSGAATPTLAAATVSNEYAGMGNSAQAVGKELSRAFATSTLLDNKQRALNVEGTGIANNREVNDLEIQSETLASRKHLLKEQLQNDYLDEQANAYEKEALLTARQTMSARQEEEYLSALREGIVASAKDVANRNWRNNVGAFTGAVSQGASAINSGASAVRAAGAARLLLRRP